MSRPVATVSPSSSLSSLASRAAARANRDRPWLQSTIPAKATSPAPVSAPVTRKVTPPAAKQQLPLRLAAPSRPVVTKSLASGTDRQCKPHSASDTKRTSLPLPSASASDTKRTSLPRPSASVSDTKRTSLPRPSASVSDTKRTSLPRPSASASDTKRTSLPRASASDTKRTSLPRASDSDTKRTSILSSSVSGTNRTPPVAPKGSSASGTDRPCKKEAPSKGIVRTDEQSQCRVGRSKTQKQVEFCEAPPQVRRFKKYRTSGLFYTAAEEAEERASRVDKFPKPQSDHIYWQASRQRVKFHGPGRRGCGQNCPTDKRENELGYSGRGWKPRDKSF